jgi:hypothetical protein
MKMPTVAKDPTITTTTINSTSVKPRTLRRRSRDT